MFDTMIAWLEKALASPLMADKECRQKLEEMLKAAHEEDKKAAVFETLSSFAYSLRRRKDRADQRYQNFFNISGYRAYAALFVTKGFATKGEGHIMVESEGAAAPWPLPEVTIQPKAAYRAWQELEFAYQILWAIDALLSGKESFGQRLLNDAYALQHELDPYKVPLLAKMIEAGTYDPETDMYTGE